MAYIVWQRNYSVGVPSIDFQHEKLVGIINTLYDRISNGKASEGFSELLSRLRAYADDHFRHEEILLGDVNYSDLKDQNSSHNSYRARVAELSGAGCDPSELLSFLKDWWVYHITKSDMLYKDALKGKP